MRADHGRRNTLYLLNGSLAGWSWGFGDPPAVPQPFERVAAFRPIALNPDRELSLFCRGMFCERALLFISPGAAVPMRSCSGKLTSRCGTTARNLMLSQV